MNKQKGNLLEIRLKYVKFIILNQKATDSFNNHIEIFLLSLFCLTIAFVAHVMIQTLYKVYYKSKSEFKVFFSRRRMCPYLGQLIKSLSGRIRYNLVALLL
jgi:hypothetical protein